MTKLQEFMATSPQGAVTGLQESFLKTLSTYRDLFYPKVTIEEHDQIRSTIALHAMNHVIKYVGTCPR